MPGRTFTVDGYRFGFNGKEILNDVLNQGSIHDFGERLYNGQIGRWFSKDKFENKYPAWAPYVAMMNNPCVYIDAKGDSVELIIGKPYTNAAGVEHPYGHVALRVFNASEGYNKVFDFGRYGDVWGFLDSEGEGILNAYFDGKAYSSNEMKIRSSVGYMNASSVKQDKQILAFFDEMIKKGKINKKGVVPGGGGTAYKLIDDYHAYYNNCTTLTSQALGLIGMNWLEDEYDPREALKTMESSYKELGLTRTEYNKGGKVKVTYIPSPLQQYRFGQFFNYYNLTTPIQRDNTTVVTPKVKLKKRQ